MICQELSQNDVEITAQIIGVIGTLTGALLGAFLGWFLGYLQSNLGKFEIEVNEFKICKSGKGSYFFNIKLFFCSHSLKRKYIKDVKIDFYHNKQQIIQKIPKYDISKPIINSINNKNDVDIIYLEFNKPKSFFLFNLFNDNELEMLLSNRIDKVIMSFKNEKNRSKKL